MAALGMGVMHDGIRSQAVVCRFRAQEKNPTIDRQKR